MIFQLCLAYFFAAPMLLTAQGLDERAMLARLSSDANRFAAEAPGYVGTETLQQTVAGQSPRRVVSEYALVRLPEGIREIRRVATIDGKKAKGSKHVDSLALMVTADNEAARRKLLEQFERNGLRGVASDFGPMLLLFAHGNTEKFEFSGRSVVRAGERLLMGYRFQQLDGAEALTVYDGDKPVKQKLRGQVWVNAYDGRLVRITLDSEHDERNEHVRDTAIIDYQPLPNGLLMPVTVVRRQFRAGSLSVQDAFVYSDFHEVHPPTR